MAYNYKTDQKLQAQLLAEIEQLIQQPANSICADCGARLRARAAFCSITLGVWLCNRCYGIHRAIGTHVTRTKCVGLDAFSRQELEFMRAHGNARAARLCEAAVPPSVRRPSATTGNSEVEAWIRAKYEHRLYFREHPPANLTPAAAQTLPAAACGAPLIDLDAAPPSTQLPDPSPAFAAWALGAQPRAWSSVPPDVPSSWSGGAPLLEPSLSLPYPQQAQPRPPPAVAAFQPPYPQQAQPMLLPAAAAFQTPLAASVAPEGSQWPGWLADRPAEPDHGHSDMHSGQHHAQPQAQGQGAQRTHNQRMHDVMSRFSSQQ
jgi:stromal membrane-associated protein